MATGMIQDNMGRPKGDDLSAETVGNNIKMPPELQEAYDRVVIAGMKVMFSEESHKMLLQFMESEGTPPEKLGKGIAGLMLILFKESNETIPPQVIIPAAVQLLMRAADFAKKSGMEDINNEDIAGGIELMIAIILEKFGVDPTQLKQILDQYDETNVNAAQQQMGVPNA
jgi:hypothetical protein